MPQVPQLQTAPILSNVKSIESSTNFCDLRNDDRLSPAEKKQFIGMYDEIIKLELISKQEWEIKWSTWMKTSPPEGQTLFQRIINFVCSVAMQSSAQGAPALVAMVSSISLPEAGSSMRQVPARPRFEFSATLHLSPTFSQSDRVVSHSSNFGTRQRPSV